LYWRGWLFPILHQQINWPGWMGMVQKQFDKLGFCDPVSSDRTTQFRVLRWRASRAGEWLHMAPWVIWFRPFSYPRLVVHSQYDEWGPGVSCFLFGLVCYEWWMVFCFALENIPAIRWDKSWTAPYEWHAASHIEYQHHEVQILLISYKMVYGKAAIFRRTKARFILVIKCDRNFFSCQHSLGSK